MQPKKSCTAVQKDEGSLTSRVAPTNQATPPPLYRTNDATWRRRWRSSKRGTLFGSGGGKMHPPELTDWRLIGSDKMQGSGMAGWPNNFLEQLVRGRRS